MPRKPVIDYSLEFRASGGGVSLRIRPAVLIHFETHRQRRWYSREAGGQLFATFNKNGVAEIVEATGPRPTDKRSRYGYEPDRSSERREIEDRFPKGLHFVGDWHTHPEHAPKPSATDEENILDVVRSSKHDQPGFFLIVVGLADFPKGLHVSFHSATRSRRLRHVAIESCAD